MKELSVELSDRKKRMKILQAPFHSSNTQSFADQGEIDPPNLHKSIDELELFSKVAKELKNKIHKKKVNESRIPKLNLRNPC